MTTVMVVGVIGGGGAMTGDGAGTIIEIITEVDVTGTGLLEVSSIFFPKVLLIIV